MIDARGYSCPMPVMMVKKELDSHPDGKIEVMVDSRCSRDNIEIFAKSRGYSMEAVEEDGDYHLTLHK
ncbi:MAG: sulfurtransferase TusA family protein [Firmicutes bacterium]|nr:sulfurtransferase TusA family protein [Bacillota bacterium]